MTKAEYLEAAAARYDELQKLNQLHNFYDYEVEFVKIWNGLGREVLEKNIGALSKDKRKKNLTTLGYVTINNSHQFSRGNNGFQISPRMQELMAYAGQVDSYENSHEVIKEFINVEVSSTQVYRVADLYGNKVGESLNNERLLEPVRNKEVLYVQADGSMILTRDKGWSEVKLGRVFKSSHCLHAQGKQGWISHSQYLAHLGGHKRFCSQMDSLLDDFGPLKERMVFITDGAAWLKNWIEDSFPGAVSILDFYHAIEHLHEFSSQFFKDKDQEQR